MNISLLEGHVSWEKLSGKLNHSMYETKGFGSLYTLELGRPMVITGDYGVFTSIVKLIEDTEIGIKVYTSNSIYLIQKV